MAKEKKDNVEEQEILETETTEAVETAETVTETPVEEEAVDSAEPTIDSLDAEESEAVSEIDDDAPKTAFDDDPNRTVTVQSLQFASFEDSAQMQGEANKNLDILMDIKLQLTVELGRTELPIKKVLELTRGSIIELEKIAGEPVELYANGKLVAHGEVVVIEDNFGLRITSITEPKEILKSMN